MADSLPLISHKISLHFTTHKTCTFQIGCYTTISWKYCHYFKLLKNVQNNNGLIKMKKGKHLYG